MGNSELRERSLVQRDYRVDNRKRTPVWVATPAVATVASKSRNCRGVEFAENRPSRGLAKGQGPV